MSRYTSAYNAFVLRLDEVTILVRQAKKLEHSDPIRNRAEINAHCRAAVVLLCSHIEGYIKDLSIIALDQMVAKGVSRANIPDQFFYQISRDTILEIKDTSDPEKIGSKVFDLFNNHGAYWSKAGPFPQSIPVDAFIRNFASPAEKKIAKLLKVFGYSSLKTDLIGKLGINYPAISNNIQTVVATRNEIAHGDATVTKTPLDVESMAKMSKAFVRALDDAVSEWFKITLCSIRI